MKIWGLFDESSEDEDDDIIPTTILHDEEEHKDAVSHKEDDEVLSICRIPDVYFRHHHSFFRFFTLSTKHILVSKSWRRDTTRYCKTINLRDFRCTKSIPAIAYEMRPDTILFGKSISSNLALRYAAIWKDSLTNLNMSSYPHRNVKTIVQILQRELVIADFSDTIASRSTLIALNRPNKLEKLNLSTSLAKSDLSDQDLQRFLQQCTNLKHINLSGNANLSFRAIMGCATSKLQNVSLEFLKCDRIAWDEICKKHGNSLRALNLGSSLCEDDEFRFENLSRFKCLRTLGLSNIDRSRLPIDCVKQLSNLSTLRELDLSHTEVWRIFDTDDDDVVLPNLRVMWLRCTNISDDGLFDVMRVCTNLTDLDIGQCKYLSNRSLWKLPFWNLKRLVMDYNSKHTTIPPRMRKSNLLAFSFILHNTEFKGDSLSKTLLRLNLSKCRGCIDLSSIRNRCKVLKTLRLDDSYQAPSESDLIKYLTTWPSLRVLSMNRLENVTDRLVRELAKHNRLHELYINGCTRVTAASVLSIEMFEFHELRVLDITGTSLVDAQKTYRKLAGQLSECRVIYPCNL